MHLRLCLILCAALFTGCAGKLPVWSPANVKLVDDRVEMPVDFPSHGLPTIVVERSTNNDEAEMQQTLAIIDTGAAASIVTSKYAKSHRLDVRNVGELHLRDSFKQTKNTPDVAKLTALKFNGAELENFDAVVEDFKSLESISERLDLVLARPVFRDVLLTIDYPRRRLILERGALPPSNGRDVLDLNRDEAGALLIPVTIMNEQAWLTLDTGHTGDGLLLSRYRLLAMRWASTPVEGDKVVGFIGEGISKIGRMDGNAVVGQYTFPKPIISVSHDDDREYLGADFLRHFVMTIDQKNNRVRLSRATTAPIESPAIMRLGFEFVDKKGKIEVVDGSAAQRGGLRTDDRVRSINGFPIERFTYIQRDLIERNGTPINVRFQRDGQDMVLRVPLTVVVK
ncbi:MAG: aspartyl protease family protein [Anaerolineae bacterium]|nr:aspartyl protease family protein [Phycisphaerae bacterium]